MYSLNDEKDNTFQNIFLISRYESGKTIEYISREMHVSKKTIWNWEHGVSSPTLQQAFLWFRVIGINPMPYFYQYVFPDMRNIKGSDADARVETALNDIISTLTPRQRRMMLFILYGSHGSDFDSILNLTVAHLQTCLKDRIVQAELVLSNYNMASKYTKPENIQPDTKQLDQAIKLAKKSYMEGKSAYVLSDEKL